MINTMGHRSKNAWYVFLWISNNAFLYEFAIECIRSTCNIHFATLRFIRIMEGQQNPDLNSRFVQVIREYHTPDNVKYNYKCVYNALSIIIDRHKSYYKPLQSSSTPSIFAA